MSCFWKRNLIFGENCQKLFILARIEILDMNILDVKIIIYDLNIAYQRIKLGYFLEMFVYNCLKLF